MDLTGRSFGNYVVKSRLGGGGMGAVYLCEHPLLKRKVALKVLHAEHSRDPETVDRFFHEAKAANEIGHPNIVEVYDFGEVPADPGEPPLVYLIMELLEGRSLAAAVPGLTSEEAIHVTRQCCRALAASHDKGIVHRDIKPENIFLVRRDGDPLFVKIVDFGIAKLLRPGEGGHTRMGMVIGTPSYMSPEQCEGMGRVDHRADIYALGVVLYEMVTKRLPFVGESISAIALGHMTQPPPPPSQVANVSPEVEAIILHALEKEPGRRFQSMAEMAAALDDPAAHIAAWRAEKARLASRGPGQTLVLGAPAGEVVAIAAPPPPATRRVVPPWLIGTGAGLVGALAIAAGITVALRDRARAVPLAPAPGPAPVTSSAPLEEPAPPPLPPPPPPPVRTVAVPDAAAPAVVRVIVRTEPSGARVRRLDRGGELLGMAPVTLEAVKGTPAIEIEVAKEGFVPQQLRVETDLSRELVIPLAAKPRPRRTHTDSELKPLEL